MMGYDRDDIARGTLPWTELTPAEWRGADEQHVTELRETGVFQPYEKEYLNKDGSGVPVLVGGAMLDEAQGQGVSFVLDLTDRKRAEAAARESEYRYHKVRLELAHASRVAAMGQLTASIAHEINHPIGAALISAETALRRLTRQPPNVEETERSINRIVNDGRRAANIVGRIRDLAKKAPARKDSLEINEANLEVIGLTRNEMSKNGVLLHTRLAEGLPAIQGDRVHLQQVMLNLILNAVEAMSGMSDDHRELLISTQPGVSFVTVAVRDSGPGLSHAGFERVFETFYTTKPNGLGMGLSICRSIVEAHGGRLWASANAPKGTALQFTMPVQ